MTGLVDISPGRWTSWARLRANVRVNRFAHHGPAIVSAVVLLVMVLACFVAPIWLPNPDVVHVGGTLARPSEAHWLGTDDLGRDILARLLSGGQISFGIALTASLLAFASGAVLGIGAGYLGGVIDDVLSRIFDTLLAVPLLLLAILVVSAAGPSLMSVTLAIGVSAMPQYARLFRVLTIEAKSSEYVLSAKALGFSGLRTSVRHILTNVYSPVLVVAAGNVGKMAVAESALSFLGIGIQPPQASWGNMLSEGQPYLQFDPLFAVAPGVALCVMVLAFSFLGDGLRDVFDVREIVTAK